MNRDVQLIGAERIFETLRHGDDSVFLSRWIVRYLGWVFALCIFGISFMPHEPPLIRHKIFFWLGLYVAYLFVLTMLGRINKIFYESAFARVIRIESNIFLLSSLIGIAPGAQNYLWFVYTLPIFATILYSNTLLFPLLVYIEVEIIYLFMIFVLFSLTTQAAISSFLVNSAILLLLLFVLYHLVRFSRYPTLAFAARKQADELKSLYEIGVVLSETLKLDDLLEKFVSSSVELIRGSKGFILIVEDGKERLPGHKLQGFSWKKGTSPDKLLDLCDILKTGAPFRCGNVLKEFGDDFLYNMFFHERVKSVVAVPLKNKVGEVVGVISVASYEGDKFTENDEKLLEILSIQAVIAIEKSRLFELEQKRRRLAETLRAASEVVGSTLNLEHVLTLILDQLRRVVPYDTASVQLLTGDKLGIIACRGFNRPDRVLKLTFPVDLNFPNYHVIVNKKPHIVDNVRSRYSHFEDGSYQATHVRSWLGVPLLFKGKVIGMMSLDSKTVDYYSQEHEKLAMAFANQAAIAIENARLHEKVQSRLSESTALVEVSKSLLQVLELQDLLQLIIDSAVKLIRPADGGMIHLLDRDTKKLQPKAWLGADPASVRKATLMEMGQGIAGHVIEKLATVNVPDVNKDPQFYESARASYFKSLMVAPMYIGHGEKRIGTLSVHSKAVGAFTASHKRLLTTLASQAATAIANAELFDVRQQKREQLQGILEVYKNFDVESGIDKLLQRIAQAAGEILRFNMVALKIADPMGQNLIVQALGESDEGWQSRMIRSTVPIDEIESLIQEECKISHSCLIRHGQELWDRTAEWHTDTPHPSDQAEADWFPSIAVLVPLETQDDKLVGVLALGEPRWHQLPSQDDVQVAEIFASAATVAIENARLYEAEKRRATQMAVISEVAQDVTAILELEALLQGVVESIRRGFDYHHVALFLVDEMAREIIVHAIAGAYADVMPPDHRIPLCKGMAGWAAYTGETQLANDVKQNEHYFQGFPAAAATQAELDVPLKLTGNVIGVLDIQSDQLNAFDETDVLAMETLSDQIAVAIENARLFSSVQRLNEFNENIVQSIEGGVLIEDAEGYIRFVNPNLEAMLGYSRVELVGRHWSEIVQPGWLEKVAEETKNRSEGVKGHYEAALRHRDGTEVPVVVKATPLFENGKFTGVLTVFIDITETRRRIAKAERNRLQGELHEALNILHAGVMLEAEASQYWLQEGQYDRVELGLNRLWRVARFSYGELSNILQDLRDPILEKEGLVAALRNYAEIIKSDKPDLIQIHSELGTRLAPNREHALYRIAQGAINNALRHADLPNIPDGQIWVDLIVKNRNVTLQIKDNGKGFDIESIKLGYPMAFGLQRMTQWAGVIGSTLEIDSKPGRGTQVSVSISIEEGESSL